MNDWDRDVGLRIVIDTNAINARQSDPALNKLEQWRNDGVIDSVLPESSYSEAVAGCSERRRKKAQSQIVSESLADTANEKEMFEKIQKIVFPGGADTPSKQHDIEIIFNAYKYGGILVTNDGDSRRQPGGVLGNAQKLREIGITVMRPAEAVEKVQAKITVRDERIRYEAAKSGEKIPDWVGKD